MNRNDNYIIVANMFFLKKLKSIDGFKINLGTSIMKKENDNTLIVYDDEFIFNYKLNFKRVLNNFGSLGIIKLYEDILLKNLEFVLFKNNKIYEFNYTLEEISDIRKYLSKILKNIDEEETKNNYEIELIKLNNENDKWIDNSGKNVGKIYEVNQKLSKEDYINELLKKKKSQV